MLLTISYGSGRSIGGVGERVDMVEQHTHRLEGIVSSDLFPRSEKQCRICEGARSRLRGS
jgi:hypothetical protein